MHQEMRETILAKSHGIQGGEGEQQAQKKNRQKCDSVLLDKKIALDGAERPMEACLEEIKEQKRQWDKKQGQKYHKSKSNVEETTRSLVPMRKTCRAEAKHEVIQHQAEFRILRGGMVTGYHTLSITVDVE